MLEVADALAIVLQHARPLAPVAVPFAPALLNRVIAAPVVADRDSPPFAKSLRDGYAVRSVDCTGAAELRAIEEIAAGTMPRKRLGPGQCARIYTGAPVPDGADAVVMQEDAEALGERVRISGAAVRPGQYVFPRGAEMRAGAVVIPAGMRLSPGAVGVLASVGCAMVPVIPVPQVTILATGDELVEVGAQPGPGQIRNSNGPMLAAQTATAGGAARECGIARDTEADLHAKIGDSLNDSDVLLLAGGVSAGKFDLVPGVLQALGVVPHFHKVRMKPGKPLFFGTKGNIPRGTGILAGAAPAGSTVPPPNILVFGLPGNPVSAFVCFELFVRPVLRKLAGELEPGPLAIALPLIEGIAEVNDRPTYRPAKLEAITVGWGVRPLPWQGAPDLRGLMPADALIVLPAGESRIDPGTPVNAIAYNCTN